MHRLAAVLLVTCLLAPTARAGDWLTYDRSGGFTGWSLKVAVDRDGRVSVVGTRQDPAERERERLSRSEIASLERLLKVALASPPRKPLAGLRHLADGLSNLVTVQGDDGDRLLVLSDGYSRFPGDAELLAELEALARRPPAAAGSSAPGVPTPERESPPSLDLVVVGPDGPAAGEATALLLELPVGRGHERPGRTGALELLLLSVLGAERELLLDSGPELVDPDTGRWSLTITAARTRLLVVLEGLPPAALRDTTARLRRLLQRAEATLDQVLPDELDHQRRRLADAVHDRADDPRVRRGAAARQAAWGDRLGAAPSAFSVSAIDPDDLRELARAIRKGHARLVVAGPLAGTAASLLSRGFAISPRGPLTVPDASPNPDGPPAPTNEQVLAAGATEISSGLAGSLALDIARRRQSASWFERLEPGSLQLPVPGDTLLLVAPGGAARDETLDANLRRALLQVSTGLSQATIDTRLRRRTLGRRSSKTAAVAAGEAADLLELGVPHPGSERFDAAAIEPAVDAASVRAAAAALAASMTPVPAGPVQVPQPPALAAAVRTLLGGLDPALVEITGETPEGPGSLLVDLDSTLALRLEDGTGVRNLEAGSLAAAGSAAAARERALILSALAEPEILVAGAARGLFPMREAPGEILEVGGQVQRCLGLEVLVPAQGSFRLLIEPETGQVRAVDRLDARGATVRLEMSDIREFDGPRLSATRRTEVSPTGSRVTRFAEARLRLPPR